MHSYAYNKFYDLSLIDGAQSEDYLVKLPVTFDSDRGDIHVAFTESTETKNFSRVYEFGNNKLDFLSSFFNIVNSNFQSSW